nr:D-alanyl-D-alanine carboxypeptidase family protein [Paenibacillus bovis]
MKGRRKLIFVIIVIVAIGYYLNKDTINQFITKSPIIVAGEAAVLMDEQTGEIIYSKNKQDKLYPASTTKLLTALVVLDNSEPTEQVRVGNEVLVKTEGEARAGLFEGQVQTVEELLAAMLLQSGNDAARSLAVYIANKEKEQELPVEEAISYFAELMNEKAVEIGATQSNFINPHGLHDEKHYSTALDIAKIARVAKQNELIDAMVGELVFSTETHTYTNRNLLLNPDSEFFYEPATGLKTGFTDQAGYCLVSSAERDEKKLIAVILNSGQDSRWRDSIKLLDYGFSEKTVTKAAIK